MSYNPSTPLASGSQSRQPPLFHTPPEHPVDRLFREMLSLERLPIERVSHLLTKQLSEIDPSELDENRKTLLAGALASLSPATRASESTRHMLLDWQQSARTLCPELSAQGYRPALRSMMSSQAESMDLDPSSSSTPSRIMSLAGPSQPSDRRAAAGYNAPCQGGGARNTHVMPPQLSLFLAVLEDLPENHHDLLALFLELPSQLRSQAAHHLVAYILKLPTLPELHCWHPLLGIALLQLWGNFTEAHKEISHTLEEFPALAEILSDYAEHEGELASYSASSLHERAQCFVLGMTKQLIPLMRPDHQFLCLSQLLELNMTSVFGARALVEALDTTLHRPKINFIEAEQTPTPMKKAMIFLCELVPSIQRGSCIGEVLKQACDGLEKGSTGVWIGVLAGIQLAQLVEDYSLLALALLYTPSSSSSSSRNKRHWTQLTAEELLAARPTLYQVLDQQSLLDLSAPAPGAPTRSWQCLNRHALVSWLATHMLPALCFHQEMAPYRPQLIKQLLSLASLDEGATDEEHDQLLKLLSLCPVDEQILLCSEYPDLQPEL